VRPLPKTLPEAVTISQVEHPAITALLDGVDAAQLQIKIAEGALYPQVSVTAQVTQGFDVAVTPGQRQFNAEIMGQLTIPIYQGGAEYAAVRQSKESLTVQELRADSARDQIRQNVVAAWGLNEASVGVVRAARAAQQALLQARTTLVQAEHDQVVNSYSLLSSIGRLNIPTLGLAVAEYDPRVHFDQVKSKWIGLRTPSGQ
jgi:outer membrane protein